MSFVIPATSGHLGRLTVQELLRRGVQPDHVVAGARDPGAIADLAASGVRTARTDYDDPATVETALTPGDMFVLVSGKDLAIRDRQHADAIAAAVRAAAGHLVYTSALHADSSPSPIAASHAATEQVVRASDLPFTLLRMGWYTENYQGSIPSAQATGVLLASVGDGRVASATRQNFAEAIAVVLSTDGHQGSTYELSGDTAWNYDDLAAALTEVLNREVRYQPVSPEQYVQTLTDAGLPPEVAQMAAGADAGIAAGAFAFTDGDLSRLLGHPTTSLVDGLRPLAQPTA